MQKTYLTIEEQVRLCFPKATKEEQQRIAAEWKAKARRMAKEPVSIETIGLVPATKKEMEEWKPLRLRRIATTTSACKPLGPNEGRIGHIPFCKPGEEMRKPLFEIGTYENGAFIPQTCG